MNLFKEGSRTCSLWPRWCRGTARWCPSGLCHSKATGGTQRPLLTSSQVHSCGLFVGPCSRSTEQGRRSCSEVWRQRRATGPSGAETTPKPEGRGKGVGVPNSTWKQIKTQCKADPHPLTPGQPNTGGKGRKPGTGRGEGLLTFSGLRGAGLLQ